MEVEGERARGRGREGERVEVYLLRRVRHGDVRVDRQRDGSVRGLIIDGGDQRGGRGLVGHADGGGDLDRGGRHLSRVRVRVEGRGSSVEGKGEDGGEVEGEGIAAGG